MWLLLFFLAIFFLLFLVIVGTDFVSYEYEDNGEAEDAEDEDGEENHVALLPTLRQRCILCCQIGQVFNNRPARMKIMIFPVLIFVFTKAFYKVMQNIKSTWRWIWTINDNLHIWHSALMYWKQDSSTLANSILKICASNWVGSKKSQCVFVVVVKQSGKCFPFFHIFYKIWYNVSPQSPVIDTNRILISPGIVIFCLCIFLIVILAPVVSEIDWITFGSVVVVFL